MDVRSELKNAQIENRDDDFSYNSQRKGMIWFNKVQNKVKAIFNSENRYLLDYIDLADLKKQLEAQMHHVGEVKFAMLTESQFQTKLNTDWLMINGQTLLASDYPELALLRPEWVSGLDLILPTGGDFLRINTGRNLGSFEADEFKSHNHGGGNHNHSYDAVSAYKNNDYFYSDGVAYYHNTGNNGDDSAYRPNILGKKYVDSSGTIINTEGGSETRPKNIAINAFIKVK